MVNNLPLVSVIIPIHNAEGFLEECLASTLNQTYPEIEVIAVDDDSTDKSKDIIKQYQKKDGRIKYYFTDKHNAAQSRRKGITHAIADYVCFVDADDILDREYVQILYDALKKTGVKIAAGKMMNFINSSDIRTGMSETKGVSIETDLLSYFSNNYHSKESTRHIAQSINAKLFAKELLENIDYSVLKTSILEDNYIIAQIFKKALPHEVALVDATIYFYRQNQNSTMGNAVNQLIPYGKKEISYPHLFDVTMEYINNLYNNTNEVICGTNKVKAEEYYGLAEVVVTRNIQIKERELQIEGMKNHIAELESEQKYLNENLQNLLSSHAYKAGRIVTTPLRFFKTLLKSLRT